MKKIDFSYSPSSSIRKRPRTSGVLARGNQQVTWENKKLPFAAGLIQINGSWLEVERIGEGSFHRVFSFKENQDLEISGSVHKTQDLVLKILHSGNVGPNKAREVILDDILAYNRLMQDGIPVAKFIAEPTTFIDSTNPSNGKFWLQEKMHTPITGDGWKNASSFDELSSDDKKVLTWAKDILTRMAKEKKDIVNDFRKRNTMLDQAGNPKIVDPSKSEEDQEDFKLNLCIYVKDWSNGNPQIMDWLSDQFSANLKFKAKLANYLKNGTVQNALDKLTL